MVHPLLSPLSLFFLLLPFVNAMNKDEHCDIINKAHIGFGSSPWGRVREFLQTSLFESDVMVTSRAREFLQTSLLLNAGCLA
jgi:hypothetical protein